MKIILNAKGNGTVWKQKEIVNKLHHETYVTYIISYLQLPILILHKQNSTSVSSISIPWITQVSLFLSQKLLIEVFLISFFYSLSPPLSLDW
jgi:hypothetical protein